MAAKCARKLWTRWSAGLICATLALAIVRGPSSASQDSGSRTPALDAAQKHFASLLREPLPGHAGGAVNLAVPFQTLRCITSNFALSQAAIPS